MTEVELPDQDRLRHRAFFEFCQDSRYIVGETNQIYFKNKNQQSSLLY